jgi:hypothetical protein
MPTVFIQLAGNLMLVIVLRICFQHKPFDSSLEKIYRSYHQQRIKQQRLVPKKSKTRTRKWKQKQGVDKLKEHEK